MRFVPGLFRFRSASLAAPAGGAEACRELHLARGVFLCGLTDERRVAREAGSMVDLAIEREHLAKADSDIADGARRIAAQALLIERLRRDKHATGDAEKLLLTFEQTLESWKEHREAILAEIARLENEAAW